MPEKVIKITKDTPLTSGFESKIGATKIVLGEKGKITVTGEVEATITQDEETITFKI